MASGIRHAEQERAQWAYRTVADLKQRSQKPVELKGHLRKLPSHIQTSGLAQSLLFYGQKEKVVAEKLAAHLGLGTDGVARAVDTLVASATTVRMKTRDALAAAQWMKRFAEVLIEEKSGGGQ